MPIHYCHGPKRVMKLKSIMLRLSLRLYIYLYSCVFYLMIVLMVSMIFDLSSFLFPFSWVSDAASALMAAVASSWTSETATLKCREAFNEISVSFSIRAAFWDNKKASL